MSTDSTSTGMTYFKLGERVGSARHRFQGHGLTLTNPYPVRRPLGATSPLVADDNTTIVESYFSQLSSTVPIAASGFEGQSSSASALLSDRGKRASSAMTSSRQQQQQAAGASGPSTPTPMQLTGHHDSNVSLGTTVMVGSGSSKNKKITLCDPLFDDVTDNHLWRNDDNSNLGVTASELISDVGEPLKRKTANTSADLRSVSSSSSSSSPLLSTVNGAMMTTSQRLVSPPKHLPGRSSSSSGSGGGGGGTLLMRPSSGEYLTRLYQMRNMRDRHNLSTVTPPAAATTREDVAEDVADLTTTTAEASSFRRLLGSAARRVPAEVPRSTKVPQQPDPADAVSDEGNDWDEFLVDASSWDILANAFPNVHNGAVVHDPFREEVWQFELEQIRDAARRSANPPPPPQSRRQSRKLSLETAATPERPRFRDRECEKLRDKLAHLLSSEVGDVPMITFTFDDGLGDGDMSFVDRARKLSMSSTGGPQFLVSGTGGALGYDSDWASISGVTNRRQSLQRRIVAARRASSSVTGGQGGQPKRRDSQGFSMTDFADIFGLAHRNVVDEQETNIPVQDLHLLQLYCSNPDTVIIYRPVSDVVPDLYAGDCFLPPQYCDPVTGVPKTVDEIDPEMTFPELLRITRRECRVKGKGIGVALKSSPYPPIEGLIPLNPNLSKTYSDARKKERALEDQLMRTRAGCISTALLRKIRLQRSVFGAATSVAVREIHASVDESNRRLEKLMAEYRAASAYARDKLSVSLDYLNRLNESQFLGKDVAKWRGLPLFYRVANAPTGGHDVERGDHGYPQFYCKSREGLFFPYFHDLNEIGTTPLPESVRKCLHPVEVLTHRSFIISSISHRIEPDPQGDFLIGPDFDGFAYAKRNQWDLSVVDFYKACEARTKTSLLPTFGLVSAEDVEHVLDMRRLTEWKQSHGYECSNTVKTQDVGDGNYTVITPTDLFIATNIFELMEVYSVMWKQGFPLLLNPNWKVMLHPTTLMPIVIGGDDVTTPIIDDCGYAFLKYQLAEIGKSVEDIQQEAYKYIEDCAIAKRLGQRNRFGGLALVPRAALVFAKKMIAEKFFLVRKWSLMPPLVVPLPPDLRAKKLEDKLETFMGKMASKKSRGGTAAASSRGGAGGDSSNSDDDSDPLASSGSFSMSQNRNTSSSSKFDSAVVHGASKKDPINREFELYRDQRVAHLLTQFEEDCAVFEGVFGEEEAKFTRRLRQYFDKEAVLSAAAARDHFQQSMSSMNAEPSPTMRTVRSSSIGGAAEEGKSTRQRSDRLEESTAALPAVSFLAPPKNQREKF